jgi:Kelch motif protein
VIREIHLPPPAVTDLEPAGGKRPTAAAAAAAGPKQVALLLAALLLAVLVGGAVAGRSSPDRPRHRLAFDEPTPAGAGESAAGVGALEPTRPPHDIPDGWAWRPVGPLSGRQGNIAVWTGTEAIYWGGDRPGRPPEGAAYDPRADRWRRLSRSPLTNRTGAAATWTGREVLVFGGVNGGGPQRDGAAYDPVTDRWRMMAAGPLSGRVPLATAWTGTEFVVVGARGPGLFDGVKDAAAYDPVRDSWRELPGLPMQLNNGGSVWTGSELIVYGTFLDRQRSLMSPDTRARGAALDPVTGHWRDLPIAPLSGQSIALVWNGSAAVGWDHGLHAAAYDRATDLWRPLPDLPLEGRDCLPRGISADTAVFAIHCGQVAVLDRQLRAWETLAAPTTAVDAPVWIGDGVIQWLGPSGRSDDGTWFRPLTP